MHYSLLSKSTHLTQMAGLYNCHNAGKAVTAFINANNIVKPKSAISSTFIPVLALIFTLL